MDYEAIGRAAESFNLSKAIIPVTTSKELTISKNNNSSVSIPQARKIGMELTSIGIINQLKVNEEKKPRGRPKKVVNQLNIQNNAIINNINITNNNTVVVDGVTIPVPAQPSQVAQIAPNFDAPKPKRKYTKRIKPITPIPTTSNNINDELD